MAEQTVRRYTSDGISDNTITAANKRGVCEIADEYYMDKNPQIDNENKIVSSFNNAGYSETYVQRKQASADTIKTAEDTVYELIHTYFTAEQLYRGV